MRKQKEQARARSMRSHQSLRSRSMQARVCEQGRRSLARERREEEEGDWETRETGRQRDVTTTSGRVVLETFRSR
jgi:hypothetical protein